MSTLKYLFSVLLFMLLVIIPTLFGDFSGLQIIWGIICLILCPPLVITIILLLTNTKWKKIAGISLIITLLWVGVVYKFAQRKENESKKIVEKEKIEEIKKAAVKVREYDYREYSFREYVYISTGRYAKRFHTSPRCKGLVKSKHVIKVSLDDAEFRYHMTPCQYCCLSYEDDIYDDNRKISWRRIQLVFSLTDDQIYRLKNIAEQKRIKTTSIYEYVGGGYSVDEIINDLKNI